MDTFFLSHGSPTLSIDESLEARKFFQSWQEKVMPQKPKAILMVSAHWDSTDLSVNVISGRNDTIYDFYGFPKPMYQLKYPAPGAPGLALKVKELLKGTDFGPVKEDKKRGLDHGAWVPLMLMYPDADVPVCQLSLNSYKDGDYHYKLGKALAPLRDEGILIIGSGSATHNLRMATQAQPGEPASAWATEFVRWLEDALVNGRHKDINNFEKTAPHAKIAHPWPDHFFPLHVALGAAGPETKAELIHTSWSNGSLSYACYRFTDAK